MKWAEEEMGIKEMFCFTGEANFASRRVAEKLGFVGGEVMRVEVFGVRESSVYWREGMEGLGGYVRDGVEKEEKEEGENGNGEGGKVKGGG